MADLRIVDAPEIPTENITGEEKLPTGGNGNYSISLDSLADYTKTKKDLVDTTTVDGKVNGVRQELDAHIEDLLNPHQVTKGQIGLGNVDNTADADKPVSNSTQAAIISAVAPKADKSYVDNALSSKSDKTYVDNQLTLKANKDDVYTKSETYAKSETYTKQESSDLVDNIISTALTPVNSSLDSAKRGVANRYDPLLTYNLGERVVLANGDLVKSTVDGNANDPNVNMTGWVNTSDKAYVGLSNVDNTSDINKPVSTATNLAIVAATKDKVSDQDLIAAVSPKADTTYVDTALSDLSTAATKFYPTLVAANTDIANLAVNQPVQVGEAVNGGLWYKATSDAASLTKSPYDLKPIILDEVNTLSNQKFQDSIKNGTYEIGDLIELTLRQENSLNARYSIANTPLNANFVPTPINIRACYSNPISVIGDSVVHVSAPTGYSIGITEAQVIGGAITYDSGWLVGEKSLKLNVATKYIGFSVRKNDDSVFNLTQLNNLNFKIAFSTGSASLITDILSKLKQKRITERYKAMEFWNGSFNGSTGYAEISIASRLSRMKALPVVGGTVVKITAPSGFSIALAEFSELGNPVVFDDGWHSNSIERQLLPNTRYIHTNVKLPNDANVDLSVLDNQAFTIEYTRRSELVDTSLLGGSNSLNNSRIEFDDLNQAHGGITTFGAPFDSIDAIIHASKIGFKLAEADIVMTADNEFVCMHDTQYNNTYFTNPDGSSLASPVNVNSLTLAQAQSQFLQRSSIAKYRKPVQTVDEYFETCLRYNLQPYIEIKQMNTAQANRLANKAKKFFAPEGVTVISFNQSYLTALNNFGNFKLGLLTFTSSNALIDQVKALGSNFFVGVPQNTLTQAIKDYADAKGVLVSVWTTTTNAQLNTHLSRGVQLIATDDMPPIHGAKGNVFKAYSSGLNFNDFILNNAVVNGGVLELQAGGSAEFTFDVGAKNIAFLSDIVGKGEFTYSLYVAGNAVDYVQISSAKDIQAKLNKLAVSTASIGLLIQATSLSKISDLSFEVVEVSV